MNFSHRLFFAPLAAAALLLTCALPGKADLIKQGTAYSKTVLVTDSAGNDVTGLTTSSFTATASKNGSAAVSITTPTVTEIGSGKYSLLLPASLTTTLGSLDITLTAAGTVQTDSHDQVVGFDPASDLGAAALATANTGITTANGNLDAKVSSRQPSGPVAVGGYASGQDPATLLLASPYITIPGDHTTSGTAETLTLKQMLAIPLAVGASDNASTVPAPSSTATTSYYLAGLPAVPANLVYVSTVTYGASGQQSGRTVKLAQPFPAVN